MTQHPDLFAALAAPFDASELKLRSQAGRQMPYVTARTIMNRLDEVLGPENWWDDFVPLEHSVICRMTIRLPGRHDLDQVRRGRLCGVGRSRRRRQERLRGCIQTHRREVRRGALPLPRRCSQVRARRAEECHPRRASRQGPRKRVAPSASAKTRDTFSARNRGRHGRTSHRQGTVRLDQRPGRKFEYGLLKHLNAWAKSQEFPARMVDWDAEQVSQAYAEASPQAAGTPGDTAGGRSRAVELSRCREHDQG